MIATDTTTLATGRRRRLLRERATAAIFVALIVFAAVGALVWFLSSADSTASTPSVAPAVSASGPVQGVAPRIVSVRTLHRIARVNGRPLYWAGARTARIEYTRRTDGTTFVRYLTGDAKAGDPSARYVVVATYSQPDAYERVTAIAARSHLFKVQLADGGAAVTRPGRPQNIYLVYPKLPYQVEIYAPTPSAARRLVFTGAIKPVG